MDERGRRQVGSCTIRAVVGDLTALEVDAIVNAANVHLRHGGGVAGAIARAGGPEIQAESDRWVAEHGPLAPGQAAVTTGGRLPARHVIHVAGPIFDPARGEANEADLRAAVRGALEAATGLGATSVALPAISSGIYGYPPDDATRVIADEACAALEVAAGSLAEVLLVGFSPDLADGFARGLS